VYQGAYRGTGSAVRAVHDLFQQVGGIFSQGWSGDALAKRVSAA
jgi:hypothetical protein